MGLVPHEASNPRARVKATQFLYRLFIFELRSAQVRISGLISVQNRPISSYLERFVMMVLTDTILSV